MPRGKCSLGILTWEGTMSEKQIDVSEEVEKALKEFGQIPELYSNVVRLTTNNYGTTILFGLARPMALEGEAGIARPVCSMFMSPSHAKTLFLLLRHQLRTYEEDWGEIPVPDNIAERYGEGIDE